MLGLTDVDGIESRATWVLGVTFLQEVSSATQRSKELLLRTGVPVKPNTESTSPDCDI